MEQTWARKDLREFEKGMKRENRTTKAKSINMCIATKRGGGMGHCHKEEGKQKRGRAVWGGGGPRHSWVRIYGRACNYPTRQPTVEEGKLVGIVPLLNGLRERPSVLWPHAFGWQARSGICLRLLACEGSRKHDHRRHRNSHPRNLVK